MILFVIVLGGMYSGVFTPTESAALARSRRVSCWLWKCSRRSALHSGSFHRSVQRNGLNDLDGVFDYCRIRDPVFILRNGEGAVDADKRSPWMGTARHLTLGIMLLALIPLGMALESISILVITVPLIYPVAMELGFSGVWLAVLVVKLIEIGMVTPPVGINCFVVEAGTANVKTEDVFRGVLPFVLLDMALLVVLFFIPQISLWLPSLVQV